MTAVRQDMSVDDHSLVSTDRYSLRLQLWSFYTRITFYCCVSPSKISLNSDLDMCLAQYKCTAENTNPLLLEWISMWVSWNKMFEKQCWHCSGEFQVKCACT